MSGGRAEASQPPGPSDGARDQAPLGGQSPGQHQGGPHQGAFQEVSETSKGIVRGGGMTGGSREKKMSLPSAGKYGRAFWKTSSTTAKSLFIKYLTKLNSLSCSPVLFGINERTFQLAKNMIVVTHYRLEYT